MWGGLADRAGRRDIETRESEDWSRDHGLPMLRRPGPLEAHIASVVETPEDDMHRSRSHRIGVVGLALALGLLVPGLLVPMAVAGQSPVAPSSAPTPAPTPTDDSGIEWPPMGFEGVPPGQPFAFTSDCGVWGRDPITLHGEGGGWTIDLVVTFDTYDAEAFQWFGRVTGASTAPNGVTVPIDEAALVYYDMDGRWMLVASWAAQIPGRGCAPMSPPPSAAPEG